MENQSNNKSYTNTPKNSTKEKANKKNFRRSHANLHWKV